MSKKKDEDRPLAAPVLDRLLDDEPDVRRETQRTRTQLLRQLRLSVQRDLENLLNTRWRCTSWPPDLEELECSLVNYGIPDFTGANMASPDDREALRRAIERSIRLFEPRFKTFQIEPLRNSDAADRTIRFRIEAVIYVHPISEEIVFDSSLEPATGRFDIKHQRR